MKLPVGFIESDYAHLDTSIKQQKTYKLAEVQDRIERVAFDVVRFKDKNDSLDKLWIIKEDNGDKVLVAMYAEDEDEKLTATASVWDAVSDNKGNVNVFYKGDPITKFAVETMGLEPKDARLVSRSLPAKLAAEKDFVYSLLNTLTPKERESVYTKYPELKG